MKLAIAITTAPRSVVYLNATAQSLVDAGATHLHLFAEPNSDLSCIDTTSPCGFDLIQRPIRLGNFFNWTSAANRMLEKTDAELILMCEDDVQFGRTSISDALAAWPTLADPGFLSLYTPGHYNPPGTPDGIWCPKIQSVYGALGLLFSRESLSEILDHDTVKFWKDRYRMLSTQQLACIDTCIGEACMVLHKKMWYFNPSRAQHLGEVSSIDTLKTCPERRKASSFIS